MGRAKKIADGVHGTVSLSPLEAQVVSTRAFQRLRGVKHLGLASLVFPGADYSRFAHGIGTMYVTGLILDGLAAEYEGVLTSEERQLYRLAALLHDIGHYPFSHTFEAALKEYNAGSVVKLVGAENSVSQAPEDVWMHEAVGRRVIENDAELLRILETAEVSPHTLSSIIERVEPPKFANLISSDLDADRTDYLMRTAKHTGLPYGNVDLQYLVTQVRLDDQQRICFTEKAMRAAEHLLLSRYFDYQQVSFHKTVAGLEKVLNAAVGVLLRDGLLDCSQPALSAMIDDGRWHSFDDSHVIGLMRAHRPGIDGQDAAVFDAVLQRRPPKMVGDWEVLGGPDVKRTHKAVKVLLQERVPKWEEEFGVPFWLWDKGGTKLTKVGSHVPVSEGYEGDHNEHDEFDQSVRILQRDKSSCLLQEDERSLIHVLSNYGLYNIRVYALIGSGDDALRRSIETRVGTVLQTVM